MKAELKKYPDNALVLKWLGYSCLLNKQFDESEKHYSRALELNPSCRACYQNLGWVYANRGDFRTAVTYLNRAIDVEPENAGLYSSRGEIKQSLGDKIGALSDFSLAIQLAPDNPDHYFNRADFNYNRGFLTQAMDDLNMAVELFPKLFDPYFKRAIVYFYSKKYAEAMKDAEKAIEIDNKHAQATMLKGVILQATDKIDSAIIEYNKAIALNIDDYNVYLNRASCYYALENMDGYCADYTVLQSYIKKGQITDTTTIRQIKFENENFCNKNKSVYYYQRGIARYNLKDFRGSLQFYTEGLKKYPNHSMMLSFKGNAHLALGEYLEAIECYNLSINNKIKLPQELKENAKFSENNSPSPQEYIDGILADIYSSRAECKMNLEKFDDALADINLAISFGSDIDNAQGVYYNMRGYLQLLKSNVDAAVKDFDKSIELKPDHLIAYINKAIAKVSKAERLPYRIYTIQGGINNKAVNIDWIFPVKRTTNNRQELILSALDDCNKAVASDKNFAYAYYIRGQIKHLLNHDDYCLDLHYAGKNGITIEAAITKDCK